MGIVSTSEREREREREREKERETHTQRERERERERERMMMKTLLKHYVCDAADIEFSAKIHSVYRVLVGTDRGLLAARQAHSAPRITARITHEVCAESAAICCARGE